MLLLQALTITGSAIRATPSISMLAGFRKDVPQTSGVGAAGVPATLGKVGKSLQFAEPLAQYEVAHSVPSQKPYSRAKSHGPVRLTAVGVTATVAAADLVGCPSSHVRVPDRTWLPITSAVPIPRVHDATLHWASVSRRGASAAALQLDALRSSQLIYETTMLQAPKNGHQFLQSRSRHSRTTVTRGVANARDTIHEAHEVIRDDILPLAGSRSTCCAPPVPPARSVSTAGAPQPGTTACSPGLLEHPHFGLDFLPFTPLRATRSEKSTDDSAVASGTPTGTPLAIPPARTLHILQPCDVLDERYKRLYESATPSHRDDESVGRAHTPNGDHIRTYRNSDTAAIGCSTPPSSHSTLRPATTQAPVPRGPSTTKFGSITAAPVPCRCRTQPLHGQIVVAPVCACECYAWHLRQLPCLVTEDPAYVFAVRTPRRSVLLSVCLRYIRSELPV